MVKIKVAINGFCRVGRSVFKIAQKPFRYRNSGYSDASERRAVRLSAEARLDLWPLCQGDWHWRRVAIYWRPDHSYHKRQADNQIAVGRPGY